MIRFGISEYIRNFWFNLCMVMLLFVMVTVSTILISNITEQTGAYRLAEKYMDDDSMFLSSAFNEHIEEIETYGNLIYTETFDGIFEDYIYSYIRAGVYKKEIMEYLRPSLDSGTYPENIRTDEKTISVLISHNPYGIKDGDTFIFNVFNNGSVIPVNVYVAGVISEGQKLYTDLEKHFIEMTYEDFFPVYSYEQTELVRIIISEEEMEKISQLKEICIYNNIIINPDDELSGNEKNQIWEKIKKYGIDYMTTGIESTYPKASELKERNAIIYKSIVMKYMPLCIIIILLFCICIIGIVAVKTAKNIRYYGIMYTVGMKYFTAQVMTGFEMTFNCLVACVLSVSLLTIQRKLNIVGEINCNFDAIEIIVMIGICVVTILSSIFAARGILKEQTPVEILKNKV